MEFNYSYSVPAGAVTSFPDWAFTQTPEIPAADIQETESGNASDSNVISIGGSVNN